MARFDLVFNGVDGERYDGAIRPVMQPAGRFATEDQAVAEGTFQTIARVGEIAEGQGVLVEVDGLFIALFHCAGQYYAIDDACPHQGAPLSDGVVFDQERSVTCTWHGWRFSLEDGRHLDGSRCKVATYPVRVVDGEVQILID